MKWIDKLQRKFGRYAVHDLMKYMTAIYGVGLLIEIIVPGFYAQYLCLNMQAVLHGQVWRLVTFMVYPPGGGLVMSLLIMLIYYHFGTTLERCWGAFRFNLFVFSGIFFHIVAAVVVTLLEGNCILAGANYLHMTMMLAFITEFPDTVFYVMYILPVKAKWIGIVDAIYLGAMIVFGLLSPLIPTIQISDFTTGVVVLLCVLNYIIYFFSAPGSHYTPRQIKRRVEFAHKVKAPMAKAGHHRCAVCGRTEADGDELEFRFCSKCKGNFEYCQDHLYTHKHVE